MTLIKLSNLIKKKGLCHNGYPKPDDDIWCLGPDIELFWKGQNILKVLSFSVYGDVFEAYPNSCKWYKWEVQ